MDRTLASIDLDAVEANVRLLRSHLGAGTELCAVVKADGYGHGAVAVGRAAVAAGADRLAVVTAAEATAIRAGGITAPLIVLGPLQARDEIDAVLDADAQIVVWHEDAVAAIQRTGRPAALHLKHDSGMGRLGDPDADRLLRLADRIAGAPGLELVGAMTHLACADDPDDPTTDAQLERFVELGRRLRDAHPGITLHAANSAATLTRPDAHLDMVRVGIAVYGLDPFHRDPDDQGLRPALTWTARLAAVKPCPVGGAVGYGRRFVADRPTTIGTVGIGYADGVRRASSRVDPVADVLVGGRRVPLAGTVSMDSCGTDLGADAADRAGDPVVLIGRQGDERITAEELAARTDTINYEIVCGISRRVPRTYHRSGRPVAG
ncbi:MAG: alanine racemase [Solirubrobacteraceae bacterium]|nr:alanine racemase [Solirubrobacteraceae bacterium]